jgi:hypothetical protein
MIRRSLIALFVFAMLMPSSTAVAQEVALTSKYAPVYMGVDGARFYNHPVIQTDLFVGWKNGFYGDFWVSTAADGNTRREYDKEIDITLGYGFSARGLSYAVDAAYFVVQGIDVLNLNTEVSLAKEKLSPFVRAEFYAPRKSGGPAKGTIFSGGLRSKLAVAKNVTMSLEACVKQDSGAFGYDKATLLQGEVGFDVALTSKTTLLLGVRLSDPITKVSQGDGRKKEAIWSIGLTRSF